MEQSPGLPDSNPVHLTGEFTLAGDLFGAAPQRATRSQSPLSSDETLYHASNHSSKRIDPSADLVSKKDEGLTIDRIGIDTQPTHFKDSKDKNKATSSHPQTNKKDALTGMAAEDVLVGRSRTATRANKNEPISARLPDLIGVFDDVTMPKTIDPRKKDDKGKIKIDITNRGNARASGRLTVNIFASPDPVLDAGDQLLDSTSRGNVQIQPGNTRKFIFDFTNPAGVAPGAYYLIVDLDAGKTISESNETNNAADQRVSASGTDAVLDWNATVLNAIATTKTSPPVASRSMAILHSAIYEAVTINTPQSVAREAAVAAAAHRILLNLYPTQTAILNEQLEMSLAEIINSPAKTRGIALGRSVARSILNDRATDGADGLNAQPYSPNSQMGRWQPTPPAFAPAVLPHWGNVKPFTLQSGSQFRSQLAGPPLLPSPEYAADINQVQAWGSANSTLRTADQTETALFWADGAGTFTPPGHWNLVAEQLAVSRRSTLGENARLFALLTFAQADAGMAAWDLKYFYDNWRPVTAIRLADQDGNDATIADPLWTSLIATPPFPDYVSGHSAFSGASATILASIFGDDTSFETTSIGLPGVVRSFTSFSHAAEEAGMSRIYGGIHVSSANIDGLKLGRWVGDYTFTNSPFGAQLEAPAGKPKKPNRSPFRVNNLKQ